LSGEELAKIIAEDIMEINDLKGFIPWGGNKYGDREDFKGNRIPESRVVDNPFLRHSDRIHPRPSSLEVRCSDIL
jgi:hypothetical protein